jgi:DNA-binding transcriptional LysR family regulator
MPERLVRPKIAGGQLFRVPDTPVFLYPAFAVYQREAEKRPALQEAVRLLRASAGKQEWDPS